MEMFKAGNKLSQTSFSDLFIRKENRYNLGRNREFQIQKKKPALCGKCPNAELFLVRIFLYLVQIQENTDQKNLRIWSLFTQ